MRPGQLTPENNEFDRRLYGTINGFNEAGAINPGKPRGGQHGVHRLRFASMRPGQLTPENVPKVERVKLGGRASMRPGQLTPENFSPVRHWWRRAWRRFNEAGAINPGKRPERSPRSGRVRPASMRPGQLTPENAPGPRLRSGRAVGFNEAGAINPGKRIRICNGAGHMSELQ